MDVLGALLNMAGIKITEGNKAEIEQAILSMPEIPATVNRLEKKIDFIINFIENEYGTKFDGSNNASEGIIKQLENRS